MTEARVDVSSVAELLGVAADEPQMQSLLAQLGVERPPQPKRGDHDAYVELKKLGMYLVFTDVARVRRSATASAGTRGLLLTNVTVYCAPPASYAAYEGALPCGVLRSDDADAVRSKLGEPDFTDLDLSLERWTIDGAWMFVQYDGDMSSIEEVSLQLPDDE